MPFMPGSAPKRRRSSSMCGAMPTLPAPPRLCLMRFIALRMLSNSGELICRMGAKSSPIRWDNAAKLYDQYSRES
jgi:hypothetical protein